MQGKIAIEEHFALEETLGSSQGPHGETEGWKALRRNLLDVHEERIARMDRLGIEMAVLSLNAPVLQAMADRKQTAELAIRANDSWRNRSPNGPIASAASRRWRCRIRRSRPRKRPAAYASSALRMQ